MAASVGRVWQQKVNDGLKTISAVLDGLGPSVRGEINRERAFERGDLDVVLRKGGAEAFVVISYEVRTNSDLLRQAFAEIVPQMVPVAERVYLIASSGVHAVSLPKGHEILSDKEWQHFEDEVSGLEADVIADRFFRTRRS